MGGAAGHIFHVWEASDLSFGDLKDIVTKSLRGELDNVTEKLDGQNILITYRNGQALAARSSKHLKEFGEEALDIEKFREYFTSRGSNEHVINAFVGALEDFQRAFETTSVDLDKIFKDGEVWMNIEILYPQTENVIHYDKSQLRIHNLRRVNISGGIEDIMDCSQLEDFIDEVDTLQKKGEIENTFLIRKNDPIIIKQLMESNHIADELISELDSIMSDGGVSEGDTIADFLEHKVKKFIDNSIGESEESFKELLAKRWAKGDKHTNITTLLKGVDDTTKNWVKQTEQKIDETIEGFLSPIVVVFMKLGVTILSNLEGLASTDSYKSTKKVRDKLSRSIDFIKRLMDKGDVDGIDNFNKKINDMLKHLETLDKVGGMAAVVPTEGVVFEYKGKVLKLTGAFTPILKIIGFFRFPNAK